MIYNDVINYVTRKKEENSFPTVEEIKDFYDWELIHYNLTLLMLFKETDDQQYFQGLELLPEKVAHIYESLKDSEIKEVISYVYENFPEEHEYLVPENLKVAELLFSLGLKQEAREIIKNLQTEKDYFNRVKKAFNLNNTYRAKFKFKNLGEMNYQDHDIEFKEAEVQNIYYNYIIGILPLEFMDSQLEEILQTELVNEMYKLRDQISYEAIVTLSTDRVEITFPDQIEQNIIIDKGISELELRRDKKKILSVINSTVADLVLGPYYGIVKAVYSCLNYWSFSSEMEKSVLSYILNNKAGDLTLREAFEKFNRKENREANREWNVDYSAEYEQFISKISSQSLDTNSEKEMYDVQKLIAKELDYQTHDPEITLFLNYIISNHKFVDKVLHKTREVYTNIWESTNITNKALLLKEKESERIYQMNKDEEYEEEKAKERDRQINNLNEKFKSFGKKLPKNISNERLGQLMILASRFHNNPESLEIVLERFLDE